MSEQPRRHRIAHAVTVAGLVTAAALAFVLGGASVASAHDALRGTSPADGSSVAALPADIVLTFDEPALALGTEIVVTDPTGSPVQEGAPSLVDSTVRQRVRGGPAGRYVVTWRVTSADGHPVSGTFAFTTTSSTPSSAPTASSPSSTSSTSSPSSSTGPVPTGSASGSAPPPVASAPASTGSSALPVLVLVLVLLLAAGAALVLVVRRRRRMRGSEAG